MNIKSSLAWMSLSQAFALVLQFAGSVILAHYLTPYQMGIYAVAAATVGALSIVQNLGLQALIVREREVTPDLLSTAFTINLLISVGLSAAIWGLSALGGAVLHEPGVRRVLVVLALGPLLGAFDFLPSARFEREGRFGVLSLVGTISGLCATAATVGFAIAGCNYMSIAYATLVSGGVYAVLINLIGRRHAFVRPGLKSWRRVTEFGLQMLTLTGASVISQRISDLALARLQGLSALGYYNRAGGLNSLFWNNIHLVVGRVLLVDFSRLHRSDVSLRERYLSTVELMTALLWPVFGGLAVISGPLIVAVYGERWAFAAQLLALLCLASMVLVTTTMNWELFAATGEMKTQTRIELIRSGVSLLIFLGAAGLNIMAAAGARVVDAGLALLLYRRAMGRLTATRARDLLPIYARSVGLTLLATGPSLLFMLHYRMSEHAPLIPTLLSAGVGVGCWGAGLAVSRHPLLMEALSFAKLGAPGAARRRPGPEEMGASLAATGAPPPPP